MRFCNPGCDAQPLLIFGNGLGPVRGGFRKGKPQVGVGGPIVLGHGDGMAEQRRAVLPEGQLPGGQDDAGGYNCAGRRPQQARSARPACRRISCGPREHDKHADQRHIAVAIGHGLLTDLHEANHRHQRAKIPEPSHQQVRALPVECADGEGDSRQQHSGQHRPPNGLIQWNRIEYRELGWKRAFAQVPAVGHQGIGNSVGPRAARHRHKCAHVFLGEDREHTHCGGESEERDLLDHQ